MGNPFHFHSYKIDWWAFNISISSLIFNSLLSSLYLFANLSDHVEKSHPHYLTIQHTSHPQSTSRIQLFLIGPTKLGSRSRICRSQYLGLRDWNWWKIPLLSLTFPTHVNFQCAWHYLDTTIKIDISYSWKGENLTDNYPTYIFPYICRKNNDRLW